MALDPPNTILELADRYHLLPLALVFIFLGMVSAFEMAAACCLRACGALAERYYDCRTQWAIHRRRYEQIECCAPSLQPPPGKMPVKRTAPAQTSARL